MPPENAGSDEFAGTDDIELFAESADFAGTGRTVPTDHAELFHDCFRLISSFRTEIPELCQQPDSGTGGGTVSGTGYTELFQQPADCAENRVAAESGIAGVHQQSADCTASS